MKEPAVILCERRPSWAAALRRAWAAEHQGKLPLVETRHWEELRAELLARPGAFVVVEAEARNAERLPALLEWIDQRAPTERHETVAAVAAARAWRPWSPLWRAAGACHVVFSPRQLAPLARMIARHVRPGTDKMEG
jgi:hypothetical protein